MVKNRWHSEKLASDLCMDCAYKPAMVRTTRTAYVVLLTTVVAGLKLVGVLLTLVHGAVKSDVFV